MKPIKLSIFDIFKTGPGPSSSHTIAPMKGALHFRKCVEDMNDELPYDIRIRVELYGSLSATGVGHGTDRAVVAGLMGFAPDSVDASLLKRLLSSDTNDIVNVKGRSIQITRGDIIQAGYSSVFPYSNTMIIKLVSQRQTLLEKTYYSTGGGFVVCEGEEEPAIAEPIFPYSNMTELRSIMHKEDISLYDIIMANESSISGLSKEETEIKLDACLGVMEAAVKRGLDTGGLLPGPIRLRRKAPFIFRRSFALQNNPNHAMALLNSYALAAAEENAAGNMVVTAPTSGSSGVIPAVVYLMKRHAGIPADIIREGLISSVVVAFLAKHNASIAGAEVGCQGEIGVAAAMSAFFLAHVNGYSDRVAENAAEIALEHHLGMTCDPIGGYVQIPCIERNAMGAVKSYNAYLLASCGDPDAQKVNLDQAIAVMAETGRDMSRKYKETAEGGLAVCLPNC